MTAPLRVLGPVRTRATLLALLLASCSDTPSGPPGPTDYPVTLSPSALWAGDTVTLRWGYLAEETPTSFLVSPGGVQFPFPDPDIAVFTRLSDTSGMLALPTDRHGGVNTLGAVLSTGDTVTLGTFQVGGPLDKVDFRPWGDTDDCPRYPWPREHPTGALLCVEDRIAYLEAGDGHPVPVGPGEGLVAWPSGFGVSYRSGVVIAPLGPDSVLAWNTGTDTEAGRAEVTHGGDRAIELGPGRWALVRPDGIEVVQGSEGLIPAGPTGRVLFGPNEAFVVFLPDNGYHDDALGSPVLRSSDGHLQSRIPPLSQGGGGAFVSASRFVVAGHRVRAEGHADVIRTIDVTDGSVLVEELLDQISPRDLAADRSRDRLYLFASSSDTELLLVLDQTSLSKTALMSFGPIGWGGVDYVVVIPPAGDTLQVVTVSSTDRFALLP